MSYKQQYIRFRAWHTENYPIEASRKTMIKHHELSVDGCLDGVDYSNIVLMLATGRKDKHGEDVFDGDIILISGHRERWVVSWNSDTGSWYKQALCEGDKYGPYRGPLMIDTRHNQDEIITVVGNRFENPEILFF